MNRGTISVGRVYFGANAKMHEKTLVTVNGILVRREGRRILTLGKNWPVETARMVAAALLELAEAAEAEPDPELLQDVQDALMSAMNDSCLVEDIARGVLAAFKVEKRRQP
ncbi:hypothetical protein ACBJ59_12330 [Nonomuraea sp. MTCD27]|uniref:hypothetical protein n=1 Tax=Nonomuraea sp. MTCD27 TaxID=1676747 RepID=UPI0035C18DA1